jgi:hypothetical protein
VLRHWRGIRANVLLSTDRANRNKEGSEGRTTSNPRWCRRRPHSIADDRLAVDEAGPHLEPVYRLDDDGKARRPVVAVPGEQASAGGVSARHQPVAIVLDLVNPVGAGWRPLGW